MNSRQLQRLFTLLSQPTAPFREHLVARCALELLERHAIPHFCDPAGNVVIGCRSTGEYRKLLRQQHREPARLFIAHMDHPGFHGLRWLSPRRLLATWHGGSPVKGLRGSPVWLADRTGNIGTGELVRSRLLASRHALSEVEIRVGPKFPAAYHATGLFGGFRFRSPVWQSGQLLHAQAADDLVGVFAILETALHVFRNRRRASPPFLGLLTRGEEVGFVGAIAHFELGWLQEGKRACVAISLETSRALPNARIGQGPVIRLGDRRTVFHAGYLQLLSSVAERALPEKHQRRVMDGGTCEATAATAWGLPAIGISVPLGNYHNEAFPRPDSTGRRSGERGRPAAEYVHLDDVDGLLTLCRAMMQPELPWADAWQPVRTRLRQNGRRYRPLLQGRTRFP